METKITIYGRLLKSDFYDRKTSTIMATYYYLNHYGHKGAIKNYRKRINSFSERMDIHTNTLRNHISLLKENGLLWVENGTDLRFKSKRKLLYESGLWEKRVNKEGKVKSKQHTLIVCSHKQLKYCLEQKALANHLNSIDHKRDKAERWFQKSQGKKFHSASRDVINSCQVDFGWSREKIAKTLGYKSKRSGTNIIRRGISLGVVSDIKRPPIILSTQCSNLEYRNYKDYLPSTVNKSKFVLIKKPDEGCGVLREYVANKVDVDRNKIWNLKHLQKPIVNKSESVLIKKQGEYCNVLDKNNN